MSACLKCGREDAAYPFHVLEVQTLHVRDFGGEKRVQALGLFQDYAICRECAAARLAAVKSPRKRLLLSGAAFGAIFLLGAALTAFYLRASGPGGAMRLLGFAGLVCGALGVYSSVKSARALRAEYAALPEEEALERAAWECLLEAAPKKHSDSDLTYIPVNEKTLAMKNGDLMVLYDLLPGIAIKAHRLIHGLPDEPQA